MGGGRCRGYVDSQGYVFKRCWRAQEEVVDFEESWEVVWSGG